MKGKFNIYFIMFSVITLGFVARVATAANYTEASIQNYMVDIEKSHKTKDEIKGLNIYKKQYLIDEGWKDMDVEMSMKLIDSNGRQSQRKVVKRTLEDGTSPDKTMGIFLEPADIRGTVMLTFEKSYGADEQWLYLPSLKRTKKINAQNKSGSFLGTEFSWEDISTTELSKYHYKYIGENETQWKVERRPVYEFSGYSKEITWVNKSNNQTVKIEYFDKKGDLLKTLNLGDWENYEKRFWRPRLFTMQNHQNKRKTILSLKPYKVGTGISSRLFSSLGLKRVSYSVAR